MDQTSHGAKARLKPTGNESDNDVATPSASQHTMSGVSAGQDEGRSKELDLEADMFIERLKSSGELQKLREALSVPQNDQTSLDDQIRFDKLFILQESKNRHLYVGTAACCIDVVSSPICQHEICSRSKIEGIARVELTAIKHFYFSICRYKSERMRNLLRHQRDFELARLRACRAKRPDLSSNESVSDKVVVSAADLTFLTGSANTLQLWYIDMVHDCKIKREGGDTSSPGAHTQVEVSQYGKQPALLNSTHCSVPASKVHDMHASRGPRGQLLHTLLGRPIHSFPSVFDVIECLLQDIKPIDYDDVIAVIKSLLSIETSKDINLHTFIDTHEIDADGEHAGAGQIDIFEMLKTRFMQTGVLPDSRFPKMRLNFQRCIDIEIDASLLMIRKCEHCLLENTTNDPESDLMEVATTMAGESFIPASTRRALERAAVHILTVYDATHLIVKAQEGISLKSMKGHITAVVMKRAHKQPARYLNKIQALASAYKKITPNIIHLNIDASLLEVETKMRVFVRNLGGSPAGDIATTPKTRAGSSRGLVQNLTVDVFVDSHAVTPEMHTESVQQIVQEIVDAADQGAKSLAHETLHSFVSEHGLRSVWRIAKDGHEPDRNNEIHDKLERYKVDAIRMVTTHNGDLTKTILFLYGAGVCPGMCAAVVANVLEHVSKETPASARRLVRDLFSCIVQLPASVSFWWCSVFRYLASAMLRLYVGVLSAAKSMYPLVDCVHFALSWLAIVTSEICLTPSAHQAEMRLLLLGGFMTAFMNKQDTDCVGDICEAMNRYGFFSANQDYRCLTAQHCSEHFSQVLLNVSAAPRRRPFEAPIKKTRQTDAYVIQEHVAHKVVTHPKVDTPSLVTNPLEGDIRSLEQTGRLVSATLKYTRAYKTPCGKRLATIHIRRSSKLHQPVWSTD